MALAHCVFGIGNLYGFKRIVIQNSNFIMKSFIHPMKVVAGKKRVAHNIGELLTPRAVAYWFMDDSSSSNKNRTSIFSTHSFPKEDQEILIQALINRLRRQATIQKERSHYSRCAAIKIHSAFCRFDTPVYSSVL